MRTMWMVVAGACAGGTSPPEPTTVTEVDPCELPIGVEVGTGEGTFVPLAEGDPIVPTWGPQQGWHLWTAGRLQGLPSPEISFHGYATVVSTGEAFAGFLQPDTTLDLSQPGGSYLPGTCSGTFWGKLTFIDTKYSIPAFVCELDGEEVDFQLDVVQLGTEAAVSATVRVVVANTDPNPDNPCNATP
jgi:hypothetical protein